MHELACVSGIAAAYHLGADYVKFDDFATDFFAKYLMLSHGMLFWRQEKKRGTSKTNRASNGAQTKGFSAQNGNEHNEN